MDQDQEETLTYMEEVAEAIINVQEQLDLRFGEVVALADIHKVDNLLGTIEVMRHTAQAEQVGIFMATEAPLEKVVVLL